ncbi:MAG TPA: tryptophan 2,3-dioxygenase family protein [Acidimicrobiales bacterium]|jgi:tryptophan 2,3-dioxygenase|nr:tryptophan 2,3-dioxygenase family protein [Acidimicrobiales bacterium]
MGAEVDADGGDRVGRSFGEEGGRLSYGTYLCLPELLGAQRLLSDPPAHDELVFITVHQAYELWFKLMLHELETARDLLLHGADLWRPRRLLDRVAAIERLAVDQIDVLETMTPQDFLAFRSQLAPASGFQSVQFRELEFLSGWKDPAFLDRLHHATAAEVDRLRRRLAEPTLWDAFLAAVQGAGLAVAPEEARRASLVAIATEATAAHQQLWDLAEALVTHDELARAWRSRHVAMVERQIGTKSGTGGSTGAPYLRSRVEGHYYPELWELRSWL